MDGIWVYGYMITSFITFEEEVCARAVTIEQTVDSIECLDYDVVTVEAIPMKRRHEP